MALPEEETIDTEEAAITSLAEHGLTSSELMDGQTDKDLQGLLDQVEQDTVAWRPAKGDSIGGKVIDISESVEGDYGAYPLLLIRTPAGKYVHVHCFHTVLEREINRRLERGTLAVDDMIAIKFEGAKDEERKGGKNPTLIYRVAVRRPKN